MREKHPLFFLFLFVFLLTGCHKPKIEYWPPSQYGQNLKKSEENFKNGKKEGISIWWHKNGNKQMECNFVNDKLEGISKRWYYNGNQERIDNYKNGVLDGFSKTFFQEGGVESETFYKNDLFDGTYKLYWENGELKVSGEYLNGLYNGKWIYYDYTGIKIGEGQFVKGNGKQIEYSIKSGKKTKESNFENNLKNGTETWWDDSGKKIKEIIYKDNKIINAILYH